MTALLPFTSRPQQVLESLPGFHGQSWALGKRSIFNLLRSASALETLVLEGTRFTASSEMPLA